MALQSETLSLGGASAVHLLAHDGTGGAVGGGGQLLERHRRHFDMQIDAVEERTTYPTHVTLDLRWSALARPLSIAEVTTWARIHRGDENEAGGEGAARQGARDGDLALFQRLPHHLQALAIELRQFVEEKDAVVSQADLAGRRRAAAADHAGVADGVVRRAKRPRCEQRLLAVEAAHRAVDARRFEAFAGCQGWQDRRQPPSVGGGRGRPRCTFPAR